MIYADQAIDGPVIGTLVVILDRGVSSNHFLFWIDFVIPSSPRHKPSRRANGEIKQRNLPNRRSYGKQDPFCVVRLGKEHKRTDADKRGGQTPVW